MTQQPAPKFYVYVIQGAMDWYYCGITSDICRRFFEHQSGKGKSTKHHRPYVIKWIREVSTRQRARFIEVMIKRAGVKKWMTKQKYSISMAQAQKEIESFLFQYQHYLRSK